MLSPTGRSSRTIRGAPRDPVPQVWPKGESGWFPCQSHRSSTYSDRVDRSGLSNEETGRQKAERALPAPLSSERAVRGGLARDRHPERTGLRPAHTGLLPTSGYGIRAPEPRPAIHHLVYGETSTPKRLGEDRSLAGFPLLSPPPLVRSHAALPS